jgi:glycosyltransferase involved in cell wall biosynthesis
MHLISRMNVGGPAVLIVNFLREADSVNFEHRLYTGYCASDESDYLLTVATDIDAVRIEGFGRRVSLIGDFKAFVSLIREIRSFKPHIVHSHTAKAGVLGRLASILSLHRSVRVHTYHGHLLHGYFSPAIRNLVIIVERVLGIYTHQLLAVGERVKQDLLQVGIGNAAKFRVISPGLSIGLLPAKVSSQEFFGLSPESLQCGFIGRVTQIKRPDRFLDVVSEISKRKLKLNFFIAGEGELLEICRKRILKEKLPVKILGWQSDIEKVLSAADIVLLTSDNEGTPLSLIQAGMAGLPVVATSVGSVPEIVLSECTGIVTELGVMEIADAIEKVITDKNLMLELGREAKEFTTTSFGIKRLVKNHENLYKRLRENHTN